MKLKTFALVTSFTLAAGLNLVAQTSSTSTAKKSGSSSGGARYEINLFGGAGFFNRQNDQPHQDFANGGVAGVRLTQNFWNYISLEQTGTLHGVANVIYRIPATQNEYSMGVRLRQFHFNPVFHFKPRESRIRPFFTTGFGIDYFGLTEDARRQLGSGVNTPFRQTTPWESQYRLAFNYGLGLKAALTERIGLRFDTRGFVTATPDFGVRGSGLPGAIVHTRTAPVNYFQTTGGLVLMLGAIDQGPVCEFRAGSIEPGSKTIWVTESATYSASASNSCLGVTPKYNWMVDGKPVSGDSSITLSGLKAGEHAIKTIIEADTTKVTDKKTRNYLKKFPIPAAERTATLTVKQPIIELVSVVVDPARIAFNGVSRITSTIRYDGPAAGEEVTLKYSATEGAIEPATARLALKPGNNSHTATFAGSSLNLSPGGPSKTLSITATQDSQSKSASLTVTAPPAPPVAPPPPPRPQPMQLDDIVFGKRGARVNNCGKRILDQAFERAAAMNDYDVLLVGHIDATEKNVKVRDVKAKKTRKLDEERVLQVAAVLSAGVEPCKRLERSRIKVAYVGAEQLSPFKTSLCEATVKERASGKISAKDGSAKNRRVEIWLVPKAGPMPNGIAGIQDAPASDIQSKGCPK